MAIRITAATPAEVFDFDETKLQQPELLQLVDGAPCLSDIIVPYLNGDFAEDLSGGYLRLLYDAAQKQLRLVIELESPRQLKPAELTALKKELAGQASDGIGSGAFDEFCGKTDLSVEFPKPGEWKFEQAEGKAWEPGKKAKAEASKQYAAIAKWVKARDTKTSAAKASSKPESKQPKAEQPTSKQPKAKKPPNFKAFFRVLAKLDSLPERQAAAKIKAELQKAGGDLSSVQDGQLPRVPYRDAAVLKLLLDAGLRPTIRDVNGDPILYMSIYSPEGVRLLLERGADVHAQTEVLKQTPLMMAAFLGELGSVELLLAAGADPNHKDLTGDTALKKATSKGSTDQDKIVAALKKAAK